MQNVTIGKVYDVKRDDTEGYCIFNDEGSMTYGLYRRFEPVEETENLDAWFNNIIDRQNRNLCSEKIVVHPLGKPEPVAFVEGCVVEEKSAMEENKHDEERDLKYQKEAKWASSLDSDSKFFKEIDSDANIMKYGKV